MASAAKKGYGCYLLIGGTRVAEVTNIGEVGPECDSIEITNFDSPDGWREFMGGLKDGGTVGLELNMLPGNASQQAVRSNVGGTGTGTELTYSFVFTGAGETWSCKAFATKFKGRPGAPTGKLDALAEIKLTGPITFA